MGEFGRSPRINKNTGRDHWPAVGGGVLAGGGFSHGRTIGGTDRQGGSITSQKVSPADIAATIYRHLEIPLETTYVDASGRPRFIVDSGTRSMSSSPRSPCRGASFTPGHGVTSSIRHDRRTWLKSIGGSLLSPAACLAAGSTDKPPLSPKVVDRWRKGTTPKNSLDAPCRSGIATASTTSGVASNVPWVTTANWWIPQKVPLVPGPRHLGLQLPLQPLQEPAAR
ncbi:MAG: hypothetical protein Ct9H300mP1_35780 [Planctomycetaceae bacterium]|nr:MAG: hypothetical protein Ct9H300mP1_35780 [Planctomycetaceae bacterium]